MSDAQEGKSSGKKIDRSLVSIIADQLVCYQKEIYRIKQVLDFHAVLGINVESGRAKVLRIAELKPVLAEKITGPYINHDLAEISTEEWATAQKRFSIIEPLLTLDGKQKGVVAKRAKEAGVDTVTVYRWLNRYKDHGEVTALIPFKRGWVKGRQRTSDEIEELIASVIKSHYLTDQRHSVASTIEEVNKQCRARKITRPNGATVRARIKKIPDRLRLIARGYKELAGNKHDARPGELVGEYPLHIVQIDHTPADIILVDDVHRLPMGRPWLTLAICIHSRMVTGYFLSMNAPSAVSVAMCLVHSILPKESWLALHGVEAEWPVWGKPITLHSDNGADFKAYSLIQSCVNHDIKREFRPRKTPHWGAHIERWMGTFAEQNKKEKGATFSNPLERKEYNSEKKSIYTFQEYEERLVRNIISYNNDFHSEIGMAPIRKWNIAFFGNHGQPAIVPLPPRVADPWAFQLDFLPASRRTINPYGVEMDAMYFAEALRPWIGAKDQKTGKARKFIFRRDPRDINRIWFYDPAVKEYFEIPITRAHYGGTTVAEYVAAKKKAVEEGRGAIDHELIDRLLDQNREQEVEAAARTKKARQSVQKRKNNAKQTTPASPQPRVEPTATLPTLPTSPGLLSIDDVDTFGDVW